MRGRKGFLNGAWVFHILRLFRTEVWVFVIHVLWSVHGDWKLVKFILFFRLLFEGSLANASKLANHRRQNHLGRAKCVSSLETLFLPLQVLVCVVRDWPHHFTVTFHATLEIQYITQIVLLVSMWLLLYATAVLNLGTSPFQYMRSFAGSRWIHFMHCQTQKERTWKCITTFLFSLPFIWHKYNLLKMRKFPRTFWRL